MKKIFLIILSAVLISSCAFHSGNISSGSTVDCPFKTIVTGTSYTDKIFGLGGLDKNALIVEAKQDLYNHYLSNKNIKLTNFSVDFKNTYILFYSKTKVTVSADLYDCSPASASLDTNVTDKEHIAKTPLLEGWTVGDSIIYELEYAQEAYFKGKFEGLLKNNRCKIFYKSRYGQYLNRKIDLVNIYKITKHPENKNYFGYEIGEKGFVEVYQSSSKTKVLKQCTVVGLNKNRLLITYIKADGQERMLSVDKNLIKF
jgi:hypothetical protein